MKNKSWIIILIMGIALAISLGYSIFVSQKSKNKGESTVTTTSIIEMKATTVTIKNILTGSGVVEYKERNIDENVNQPQEGITDMPQENIEKTYQITLSIDNKDLGKAKIGQEVEISGKRDEQILNYVGKVIKINQDNNMSTLNIEITNPDDRIEENMSVNCTVIIEKAENVVALPIEAIQRNEENKEFVDVVQLDGTTIPVDIKTGISDDYYVEITYGLNVGDRVQIVKSTTTVVNKENSNVISGK
jgi:multidrug efflux pump subunit AcrA (membrane-fusion protein)